MGGACIRRSIGVVPAISKPSLLFQNNPPSVDHTNANNSHHQGSSQRRRKTSRSIKSKTPLVDARLRLNTIEELPPENLTKHSMSKTEKKLIAESLDKHFLLTKLDPATKEHLMTHMKLYKVKSKQTVFTQGQPGKFFYVVGRGKVEVLVNERRRDVLRQGQSFGELALMDDSARTATVKTLEKCSLWALHGETFREILKTLNEVNFEENMQFISSVPLLEMLTDEQKATLSHSMNTEHWTVGQNIVKEGDVGDLFYIIKEGTVVCSDHGDELRQMTKGDYFGEIALLYNSARTATVSCLTPVKVLSIGRDILIEVLGHNLDQIIYKNTQRIILEKSPILKLLTSEQMDSVLESVKVVTYHDEDLVIEQGVMKSEVLYMILQGSIADTNLTYQAPSCIGDTYLLHSSPLKYTENIVAVGETHIGMITKEQLETAIGSSLQEVINFHDLFEVFKKVPLFRNVPVNKLRRLLQLTEVQEFTEGELIVEQGTPGDSFYIVKSGSVEIRKDHTAIRKISKFDYFGERSVLLGDIRTADVVSVGPVSCWVLNKASFHSVVDTAVIRQLMKRIDLQDDTIQLSDLLPVKSLGKGTFGQVYLTVHRDKKTLYSLKIVSRAKIGEYDVYNNVVHERQVLLQLDHFMIMKLVKTFKDRHRLYFLLEYVRGMDLFDVLQQMDLLKDNDARFYTASLVLILEYLHEQNILYRDLKPENVMVDEEGYLKLIDFGTAKIVRGRTYTAIGTPHYMAPEMILGGGYTTAIDWWSVGVMLYEFLYGCLPFADDDDNPETVYKKILEHRIVYPSYASPMSCVRPLIQQLLSNNPNSRTGGSIAKLKKHRWFGVFDWDQLNCKQMKAPFIPKPDKTPDHVKKALAMKLDLGEFLEKNEKGVDSTQKGRVRVPPTDWDYMF